MAMKLRILKSVVGLVLLFAVAVLGAGFPSLARAAKAKHLDNQESISQARKLDGTWRVQVTIRNCQTGAGLRTFPALVTFAHGGTLTETTTGFAPSQRTPGHGFWRHTGENSYLAVSEAFLFNPSDIWTGTQKLTQNTEIARDSDAFASTASIEIFDISGNLLTKGCATAVGRRFE